MLKISKDVLRDFNGIKNVLNIMLNNNYSKTVELTPSQNALINALGMEKVSCKPIEKPKKDTGELYTCLELSIDEYVTTIYLDKAEQILICL